MDNTAKGFAQKIISQLEHILSALEIDRPRKNNPPPVGDVGQPQQKNKTTDGIVTSLPKVDPAPPHSDAPDNKWNKTLKGWKPTLECFGIIFAIAYAFITYCQWRDANRNFRLDERAWVAPIHACFEPAITTSLNTDGCGKENSEDTRMQFKVIYKNSGKTFALNSDSSINITTDQNQIQMPSEGTKFRGLFIQEAIGSVAYGPITVDEINNFGYRAVYIYGKIWYDDIFKGRHWTEFCFIHRGPKGNTFVTCPQNNTCDDCEQGKSNP
jgi:hypothetical protein